MIYLILLVIMFALFVFIKRLISKKIPIVKAWTNRYKIQLIVAAIALALIFWTKPTITILFALIVFLIYSKIMLKSRMNKWGNTDAEEIEYDILDKEIKKISKQLMVTDKNRDDYKFDTSTIPYGRVNAFLNYFGRDIMNEEVYYFSALPSKNEDEVREYGIAVTGSGIFLACQSDKKKAKVKEILFAGLENIQYDPNTNVLIAHNIVRYGTGLKKTIISAEQTTVPLSCMANILSNVQQSSFPHVLFENKVVFEDEIANKVKESEEQIENEINIEHMQKNISNIGAYAGKEYRKAFYEENGNYMNTPQAHGYAAEYASKTMDRVMGKKVVGVQEKENGHQALNGADKIVNGERVQIKFCKTSKATYENAFKNHFYENQTIEVPRGQSSEIYEMLQKDIDAGKFENQGIKKGTSAKEVIKIKDSVFGYDFSTRVAAAGNIQSISIDLMSGVVSAMPGASISAMIVFANAIWQGADIKSATKMAVVTSGKVIGKSAIIYTVSMQVNRQWLWKFVPTRPDKVLSTNKINPIWKVSESAAGKIANSSAAKSSIGQKIHLDTLTGQKLTSGVITVAVVFGPDICSACRGKISAKQLAKNATVGAAGIAGAAIGQTVTGGNPVGGVIGGAIAGTITKKVADNFVEDDAIQMFRILKEEFLDVVMSSYLTQEEFNEVASNTIFAKKIPKELRNMYKLSKEGKHRAYANNMINEAVIEVMKKRLPVTNEMWDEGKKLLAVNE